MKLLGNLGVEVSEGIFFYGIAKLDGIAADFTVFDVGVAGNREVQDHRDLFPAIGAAKGVFHRASKVPQSTGHDNRAFLADVSYASLHVGSWNCKSHTLLHLRCSTVLSISVRIEPTPSNGHLNQSKLAGKPTTKSASEQR